jgi:hypothetical protein
MTSTILESGMTFIAENTFHIEKSPAFSRLDKGMKSVEFIRATDDMLFFVEAKSSFPNPSNPKPNPDKGNRRGEELFREEIEEICDKFTHSLNLYSAVDIGVTEDGFPPDYRPADKVSLTFILVINGFEESWCDEIERALINKLRESICMAKIWQPDVSVINNTTAVTLGLIAN